MARVEAVLRAGAVREVDSRARCPAQQILDDALEAAASGRHEQALARASTALRLARRDGETAVEGAALRALARATLAQGDAETAIELARAAAERAEADRHDGALADACETEARARLVLGMPADAAEAVGRGLAAARSGGDPGALARMLLAAGILRSAIGDLRESLRVLDEASALGIEAGDTETACSALVEAIRAETRARRDGGALPGTSALDRARRALAIADAAGRADLSVRAQAALAELHLASGRVADAERALAAAGRTGATESSDGGVPALVALRAAAALAAGRATESRDVLAGHVEAIVRDAEADIAEMALATMAGAHEAAGDPAAAIAWLRRLHARERRRLTDRIEAQRRVLLGRAEVEIARAEADSAARRLAAERARAAELEERSRTLARRASEGQRRLLADDLTGIGNRRRLEAGLVEVRGRASTPLGCLAMADVDDFKQVNDTFGHAVGDAVLRRIARILTERCRATDVVCRVGGEEFAILLPGLGVDDAGEVAERLRSEVASEAWSAIRPGLAVTLSVGVTVVRDDHDATLERADALLYSAKRRGKNRVMVGAEVGAEPFTGTEHLVLQGTR